jgi:hypothetical protein
MKLQGRTSRSGPFVVRPAPGACTEAINGSQGHATLLLDGSFGEQSRGVELACQRVAAATRALIQGRAALYDAPK